MIKFSEFVSIGHPDKVADYISSYILDRYLERDKNARYALEVQIKGSHVCLGGEVSSVAEFSNQQITNFVKEAVDEIGYTRSYQEQWGEKNTISSHQLDVDCNISMQSPDIAKGVDGFVGWGDQGIFFGYATPDKNTFHMPYDHYLAKHICKKLYDSRIGGIDIKTQVVTEDDKVIQIVVAIPLLDANRVGKVERLVREMVDGDYSLVINGTGCYEQHSPIADCGTTGRKLVVDFYGGACRIGGGSPWTKDGSKADLTLNLYARRIAKEWAIKTGKSINSSIACSIGSPTCYISIQYEDGKIIDETFTDIPPADVYNKMRLYAPMYASACRWGLFGEYQQDKPWEVW